jgi:hypothetical protein
VANPPTLPGTPTPTFNDELLQTVTETVDSIQIRSGGGGGSNVRLVRLSDGMVLQEMGSLAAAQTRAAAMVADADEEL